MHTHKHLEIYSFITQRNEKIHLTQAFVLTLHYRYKNIKGDFHDLIKAFDNTIINSN